MILLVANIKGGVGKSTIATNLIALRAQKFAEKPVNNKQGVLLIDADEQGNSAEWATNRVEDKNLAEVCFHHSVDEHIRGVIQQNKDKYEDIVIDAGGVNSFAVKYSLRNADRLLIPLVAGQFNIWAFEMFIKSLSEVAVDRRVNDLEELQAAVVCNQQSAHKNSKGSKDLKEYLAKHLEKMNIGSIDSGICHRVAFDTCIQNGLAVNEAKGKQKDNKAIQEMKVVHEQIWS